MKKILCLIDSLGAGGAQRQMVGLATFMKEKGYDVVVAIYHKDNGELFYADTLQGAGVPYVFLKEAERNMIRPFYIAKYIRKMRPDVVISYLDVPNICACFAKLICRKFKLIVSERNTTQTTGRKEKLRFNLFRLANYVVPNAYSQEEYIRTQFPFLSKKTVTIPNFVDIETFIPSYHNQHKIPEIMIAATIWPSKNTLGTIDAVEMLVKERIKFHVSWYGKNDAYIEYFNTCQRKIDEKGIGEYISLLEKTEKIAERYREADYFCLPSFYEGTSNAICEAMASGLPIICSDVCDNPKYVTEGENGFLFNPTITSSIAEAIKKALLLSDKEYLSHCMCSRKVAELKLSKQRFVEDYIKIIEER